jgi:phosphoglycerol transferase MdoB-like AlkP superfamily enzyme
LPLDLSTAGYLTGIPLLVSLVAAWIPGTWEKKVLRPYFAIAALALSIVLIVDCALYSFWGFKLDATVWNYIDSPKGAFQSVSLGFAVLGIAVILAFALAVYTLLDKMSFEWFCRRPTKQVSAFSLSHSLCRTGALILLGGLFFLAIRGGVGRSTMNIGYVYYSDRQFLNHSAVNPAFSLIYSSLKVKKFDKLYQYNAPRQQQALMDSLSVSTETRDALPLLNTRRPNVLVVLMEGFCSAFIDELGGEKGVTPEFSQLCREGVIFEHCYANSFRTDRGTVCALSGYPSFPQISVMKLPEKSRNLPSIARSLRRSGYTTDFLYGGDINFTNMKSYLLATGYEKAIGYEHFPVADRTTHAWGVTDAIAFDTLYYRLLARKGSGPWFTTFLTLASHEPWVVPYHRIKNNERANAMAYTDHCIGQFIGRLKRTPLWKNLLVVFVADHGIGYKGLTEADEHRYRIPLLWVGGAVKGPKRISVICNQTDLPATLLGQLGIAHTDYRFSRDVMSATYRRPFAFHTFDNGFSFIDASGYTVYDLTSGRTVTDKPRPSARRVTLGKAFLQQCITDLAAR